MYIQDFTTPAKVTTGPGGGLRRCAATAGIWIAAVLTVLFGLAVTVGTIALGWYVFLNL